jgi:hypothetical protein
MRPKKEEVTDNKKATLGATKTFGFGSVWRFPLGWPVVKSRTMPDSPIPDQPRPATDVPHNPPNPRDRAIGLGLIAVSFVVALGISARSKEASSPRLATEPAPPSSAGIVGFPLAVKPLSLLSAARELTPREQLVGLAISGLKADGTVDLQSTGMARFVFRSPEGVGPEPSREYGELALKKYCGFQVVALGNSGLGALPDVSNADCKRAIEQLPPPACSAEQLWELGKQQGADPTTTATVEYYRASSGPAWWFESGTTSFAVGGDCSKVLSEQERAGVISKRVPG